jgi:hypothetical protein
MQNPTSTHSVLSQGISLEEVISVIAEVHITQLPRRNLRQHRQPRKPPVVSSFTMKPAHDGCRNVFDSCTLPSRRACFPNPHPYPAEKSMQERSMLPCRQPRREPSLHNTGEADSSGTDLEEDDDDDEQGPSLMPSALRQTVANPAC